jgi:hypothetical protein
MWNLGMCRKIYLRAKSSEHNDRDSSTLLTKMQRFTFADNLTETQSDPDQLWHLQISWQSNSHSPEDFDWLVATSVMFVPTTTRQQVTSSYY